MRADFVTAIENLILTAPPEWVESTCEALREFPATATVGFVLQHIPPTHNADLSFLMAEVVRKAPGRLSWEALSWALYTAFTASNNLKVNQHVELLWAGPSPTGQIPVRRIDQALYDLIAKAKHEILLVTFAAAKIERLAAVLIKAAQRGVTLRLILEFEQSSEGQLRYDALKAFPASLVAVAEVFHWPLEKRDRNQAGRPGKLHAKVAIVDDSLLVSSANLTDDAFNRNLEVGVMLRNPELLLSAKKYINSLIGDGTLCRIPL